ncbi:hypothetical protein BDW42DRAFT_179611 [Aspergillus taichungensis]|uniref:Uncharacterized protein n=1 Tax=Aspergillus taichungensis TaxID=482145 RepID=A0A2J5HGD8_9EURO|nr:hypothetical protein BDW42DRAFT_179611 [Aspergillus taichungensis]
MKNTQLPEPPKQAAYNQPSNPVSHTPAEQRILSTHQQQQASQPSQFLRQGGRVTRHAGDIDVNAAEATSHHHPSSSSSYPTAAADNTDTNTNIKNDIDIGYGVEQQPNEEYIAHAVQGNTRDHNINNTNDGSPREHLEGCDGYDEEDDLMAHMGRKRREHDRVLRERVERSSPGIDVQSVEREALRRRKLEEEERLDVVGAVRRGTGSPVV